MKLFSFLFIYLYNYFFTFSSSGLVFFRSEHLVPKSVEETLEGGALLEEGGL